VYSWYLMHCVGVWEQSQSTS